MTKAEKCFMLLSATFQFANVNFKQLYLLSFLHQLSETDLDGNLRKPTFMWLNLEAIQSYRLGDIGKKVQQHPEKGSN